MPIAVSMTFLCMLFFGCSGCLFWKSAEQPEGGDSARVESPSSPTESKPEGDKGKPEESEPVTQSPKDAPPTPGPLLDTPSIDEPSNARVVVEIDAMSGIRIPPLKINRNKQIVELSDVLSNQRIAIEVQVDEADLALDASLEKAEALALLNKHANLIPPDENVWHIHVIVASRLADDPQTPNQDESRITGRLFEVQDLDTLEVARPGVVIAVDTIKDSGVANVDSEGFLTTLHELVHALGLHHGDWEGKSFRTHSTIEGYSYASSVVWQLSKNSRDFLTNHPRFKLRRYIPFGFITEDHPDHKPVPSENFQRISIDQANSRGFRFINADQGAKGSLRIQDRDLSNGVVLDISTDKPKFLEREPIEITARLRNISDSAVLVSPLLDPEFGVLEIYYRRPNEEAFSMFRPISYAEDRSSQDVILRSGDELVRDIEISIDSLGAPFVNPGKYEVRAVYRGLDGTDIASEPIAFQVTEATTAIDRQAVRLVGSREQLFMAIGGGSHLAAAQANLKEIDHSLGSSSLSAAARISLANDLATQSDVSMNTNEKRALLLEAARLSDSVLSHEGAEPGRKAVRTISRVIGELEDIGETTRASSLRKSTVDEVNDKSVLELLDVPSISESSILFGSNETTPSLQANASIRGISAILRTDPAARVQIVGHSDAIGSKDYNDLISELRAKEILRQLIFLIPEFSAKQAEVAWKGEENPIADNSTELGRQINRRVEIRIESTRNSP